MTMSVELQRKVHALMQKAREREAIHELLIVVHPDVLDRLRKQDSQVLVELERRYEARLTFRGDSNYYREQLLLADPEIGKEIKLSTKLSGIGVIRARSHDDPAYESRVICCLID